MTAFAGGQGIELVLPYMAYEIRTGSSPDGKIVGLKFGTTEGVPIEIAMPTWGSLYPLQFSR
jgi:hypothetical protein